MAESMRTRLMRWGFNIFPAYRGTGGRVTYISGDWREVRVKLPLNLRTRNYVGTIFGGSIYGAVDPLYMIMLIKILGPEYVVWNKAATVRFKRPGRATLFARFTLTADDVEGIRAELAAMPSVERTYVVELADKDGVVHAVVEELLYVRRRDAQTGSSN